MFFQRPFRASPSEGSPAWRGASLWGRADQQIPIFADGQKFLSSGATAAPVDGSAGIDLARGGGSPSRQSISRADLHAARCGRLAISLPQRASGSRLFASS